MRYGYREFSLFQFQDQHPTYCTPADRVTYRIYQLVRM